MTRSIAIYPPFSGSRELRARLARQEDLGLTRAEFSVLARLSTPAKIQGFLDALPANFEIGGQTCLPVREVLRQRRAHCIEGAMLAACALWVHGEPPLLMDLQAERDYDHVVALFRRGSCACAMPWSARPAPFSSIGRREDDRPAVQSISSARRTLSMSEVRIRNRLCGAGAATVRRSSSKWACRSRGSRSSSLFLFATVCCCTNSMLIGRLRRS